MKIKESYLQEALKADKNDDKPNWASEARRQNSVQHSDAPNKFNQTSPLKDELKFANLLESSTKVQKNQQHDDSGEERRDDEKKERKLHAEKKESAENLANEKRVERYESGGSQTGGQSGFGTGGSIGGLNLSENFAARSILHIADLERMISTIRTQTALGGRREIILQLKRSVLEGLQVKIGTEEAGKVQIEFLAANEKVRSQVERHSEELAGILRGRGINLENLKTMLDSGSQSNENFQRNEESFSLETVKSGNLKSVDDDNTFAADAKDDDRFYKA